MRPPLTHLLIAFGVALGASLGYFAEYVAITNKSNTVADLQNQIASVTETAGRVASVRAALAQISNDEAKVQLYFVSESNVVAFIDDLEARGLAQKAVVNVISVSTGGSPAQSTISVELTVKGTFDAVMRTIGGIEYAPYDVSVSNLSVVQDVKNAWNANLSLVVGSMSSTTMKGM